MGKGLTILMEGLKVKVKMNNSGYKDITGLHVLRLIIEKTEDMTMNSVSISRITLSKLRLKCPTRARR
ncbi:unnamed protein product [Schistosoma margrebowiei]|uniref:Uncharacterized protein n=1 Tax=Schistosoma margrebowiei TaxID=48269 RepID=A0A183N727_9TREM|nr:unnamed protein product [Schistosoma margrebowiei]